MKAGIALAVTVMVLATAAGAGAAGSKPCKGQATAPNGLGMTDLKAKKVSCGLARKTMRKWGKAWEKSGYESRVRFKRGGHSWRCKYREVTRKGFSYGRVKCKASGNRVVKFRLSS